MLPFCCTHSWQFEAALSTPLVCIPLLLNNLHDSRSLGCCLGLPVFERWLARDVELLPHIKWVFQFDWQHRLINSPPQIWLSTSKSTASCHTLLLLLVPDSVKRSPFSGKSPHLTLEEHYQLQRLHWRHWYGFHTVWNAVTGEVVESYKVDKDLHEAEPNGAKVRGNFLWLTQAPHKVYFCPEFARCIKCNRVLGSSLLRQFLWSCCVSILTNDVDDFCCEEDS